MLSFLNHGSSTRKRKVGGVSFLHCEGSRGSPWGVSEVPFFMNGNPKGIFWVAFSRNENPLGDVGPPFFPEGEPSRAPCGTFFCERETLGGAPPPFWAGSGTCWGILCRWDGRQGSQWAPSNLSTESRRVADCSSQAESRAVAVTRMTWSPDFGATVYQCICKP